MSGMSHKSWSALKKKPFPVVQSWCETLSLLQMEHCDKQWTWMICVPDLTSSSYHVSFQLQMPPYCSPITICFAMIYLDSKTSLCHTMCLYPLILFSLSSFFIPLCQALLNTTNSTPLSTANASIDPPWPVIVLNCTTCYRFSPQDNRLCVAARVSHIYCKRENDNRGMSSILSKFSVHKDTYKKSAGFKRSNSIPSLRKKLH